MFPYLSPTDPNILPTILLSSTSTTFPYLPTWQDTYYLLLPPATLLFPQTGREELTCLVPCAAHTCMVPFCTFSCLVPCAAHFLYTFATLCIFAFYTYGLPCILVGSFCDVMPFRARSAVHACCTWPFYLFPFRTHTHIFLAFYCAFLSSLPIFIIIFIFFVDIFVYACTIY